MREESWVIVNESSLCRTPFLISVLEEQFPQLQFSFTTFDEIAHPESQKEFSGAILELKRLRMENVDRLDAALQQLRTISLISILSPESFGHLLNKKPRFLKKTSIVMSELASLNYVSELPRVIAKALDFRSLTTENQSLREQLKDFDRLEQVWPF